MLLQSNYLHLSCNLVAFSHSTIKPNHLQNLQYHGWFSWLCMSHGTTKMDVGQSKTLNLYFFRLIESVKLWCSKQRTCPQGRALLGWLHLRGPIAQGLQPQQARGRTAGVGQPNQRGKNRRRPVMAAGDAARLAIRRAKSCMLCGRCGLAVRSKNVD